MHLSSLATLAGMQAVLLGALPAPPARSAPKTPVRVAIFAERDFPTYGGVTLVAPQQIARTLRAAGFAADLLDTEALSHPDRFNARRYAAVVLPYGNTYPVDAFANLRRFHRDRGSLIATGIPFTHPAARSSAEGWSANPRWGTSVVLDPESGPRPGTVAVRIHTENQDWTGISSSRFAARPGDRVSVSLALRETTPPRSRTGASGNDNLYVRFFDQNGQFLMQQGVTLVSRSAGWQPFRATVTAPAGAAFADLSVQMRRGGRRFLVADFAAKVNADTVSLVNGDLKRRGGAFVDLGHQDAPALWGPNGIGIGGFAGPADRGPVASVRVAPGDPLRLAPLYKNGDAVAASPAPQWLDPRTVPAGVRIVPAVGSAARPLLALVVHEKDAFAGAVDAWLYRTVGSDGEDYNITQVIARATVAALTQRGLLNGAQQATAYRALDAAPRPTVYADVTLPVVPRRYETFQPKMPPPARRIYVADVRRLSPEEKVLLTSLQGIVNRKQPRVYFLFDDDDSRWLTALQEQNVIDAPVTVADPWSLVDQFRSEFKGTVVCDPKVYVSPCIAVSLAGADDLLVAMTPALARAHGLPVTVDLRGRFKNNADALHYLRTHIAPRLDPYLSCTLDPAVFHQGALDSIIAARGSVFWITGPAAQTLPGADQAAEREEVRAMFAKMPLGAVVRGFWWHGDGVGMQESDGVAMGSRLGKVTLVSDLITNLSLHSGVPAERLTQKPRPPAPPLDRRKVYVAFTMSDGDNLCTWRGYFRRYFDDPVRGTIPVGWGMSPAIVDLAPSWARWYYEKATPNDEFICDVSGVAYMYPSSWGTALKDRDAAFRWFYGRTREYMGRMDMNTIRLMDVQTADIARVGPLLPGIDYLMPDYGHAGGAAYRDLTYTLPTGQAVFRAATTGSGPRNFAEQIRAHARGARPAFVNAFIWNWGSNLSDLKKTMELLGPDYIAVTPSQLNTLYRKATQPDR